MFMYIPQRRHLLLKCGNKEQCSKQKSKGTIQKQKHSKNGTLQKLEVSSGAMEK